MSEKLTKAQRELLEDLAEREGRMHVNDDYKPVQRLLSLGYVDRKDSRMGSAPSFAITPAGRAALETEPPHG